MTRTADPNGERVAHPAEPGLAFELPLRSVDRMPTNLPVQLTSFVGRASVLAETTLLLRDRRLLTLAGAGGCGKTRLAVHLAAEVRHDFPDGAWFVDLAPLTDPGLVAGTAAAAIGIAELPGQAILDTLVDRLATSVALVVLDNCEHLLDAVAAVADSVLRRCPGVRVLVTSREPLGAEGETTYRVPSLGLPTGPGDAACESVTLFADRAALASPTMRVGPDEVAAMAAICIRLDGIPLAIELAAARCRALTPRQVADHVARHFGLLTGGSRGALPRHRALEASIEWSYDLLTDDERVLLRRLSVFAGGFTLAAAEVVGAAPPDEAGAVVGRLTSLVDKSLVLPAEVGRYRLLETVRQFAESRLAATGEATEARRRHAGFYLALAEESEPDLYGPGLLERRRVLAPELDNLRAADDWAVSAGEVDLALRLMLPLDLFWQTYLTELLQRLGRLLALPGATPGLRLLGLATAAEVECIHGDIGQLCAYTEEALAQVDDTTDPGLRGYLLVYAGWGRFFTGDESAEPLAQEGVTLLRTSAEPRMRYYLLDGLWGLGFIALMQGRTDDAVTVLQEAVDAGRAAGAPIGTGRSEMILGFVLAIRGQFDQARSVLAGSVATLTACRDEVRFMAVAGAAFTDGLCGDPEAARRLRAATTESLALQQYLPAAWGAWALAVTASRAPEAGDWRDTVAQAEELMTLTGFLFGATWAKALRAEHLLAEDDVPGARAAVQEALESLGASTRTQLARGPVELAQARVARAEGDAARAEEAAHRALGAVTTAHLTLQQIEALELLGGLATEQGGPTEAARLLAAAEAARTAVGYPLPAAQAARVAEDLERARAGVDAAIFEATWAKGAEMTLAAAVAYATRGRGPRRRPASGWDSLTPTELEVVGLVSAGLRNPEIAAKLFVSLETVKTHVRNIFAKLGVANRTELASLAARRR